MAASLRLSELTKIYGTTRAVDRLSLSIAPGNMVALLRPGLTPSSPQRQSWSSMASRPGRTIRVF
jgi:ABC-type phosphonate transport system ATPase subunit